MFLGLTPLLVGCGGAKGVERLPLHGTVTLANGEKLSGRITFLPAKGQAGPPATTALVEGNYKFDRSNGPLAGPHAVIVARAVSRASALKAIADKKAIPRTKTEWTQSADIADDGRYLHDFTLED